jgi:hypothetical protein
MTDNPWSDFEAGTWTTEMEEFDGMEITFRETGDVSALVDLVFGGVSDTDKEESIANLVTTSVVEPTITKEQFYALSLTNKSALVMEIITHTQEDQREDFQNEPASGSVPDAMQGTGSSETTDGGSGEQPSSSEQEVQASSASVSATQEP